MISRISSGGSGNDIVVASRSTNLASAYYRLDVCASISETESRRTLDWTAEYSRKKEKKPSRLHIYVPTSPNEDHGKL